MTNSNAETRADKNSSPVWCVAANVREDLLIHEENKEPRTSTKPFNAGAKVYLAGAFRGMGSNHVTVVGHFRGKGYVTSVVNTRYLTNWRAELIYSPTVIARLSAIPRWDSFKWDGSAESKVRAEQEAKRFDKFSNELNTEHAAKQQSSQE
jgi:hypothetical protein